MPANSKEEFRAASDAALSISAQRKLSVVGRVTSLGALIDGVKFMLRKTMMALMTAAAIGMVMPGVAMARGGGGGGGGGGGHGGGGFGGGGGGFHGGGGFGGGGGFHGGGGLGGGGFHGGGLGGGAFHTGGFGGGGTFHGGGFASNGFHGGGFHGRGFHGDGFHHAFRGRGFGFHDDYYPYYAYDDSYYDDGSCYVVQRRVHTKHGWRDHPVQVCS
jgi:hypothetical protein